MARIKYQDTIKGWNERGYKVTKGSHAVSCDRTGTSLFSWGQVVPSTYKGYNSYDDNDEAVEGEDYPEPDRFYGDLD